MKILHTCPETISEWRPIPLIAAIAGATVCSLAVNTGDTRALWIGIPWGIGAIWFVGCFWLGHLWMPKKWL